MGSKMLIDAAHPEEVRVVVVRGKKVEDFDYESATRKQLRGNIYLAKVTRVEPSLQAAFVDYGGNRHGFLAFSEIHPDYYQIPVADRKALLEEEAEEESRAEAEEAAQDEAGGRRRRSRRRSRSARKSNAARHDETNGNVQGDDDEAGAAAAETGDEATEAPDGSDREAVALEAAETSTAVSEALPSGAEAEDADEAPAEDAEDTEIDEDEDGVQAAAHDASDEPDTDDEAEDADESDPDESGDSDNVESVGSEDALEEVPARAKRRRRIYKIQEVIKRRQIILVQVVKEERGNKGAALTTYLSLAGRYTVLMPNTARGGGISRKITNPSDRKRLRKIASELKVPEGMGLIIRTAGASRTKAEIKRDFEYLLRLWENVRDLTLESTAPTLVYEEGNLIKRSIRDLYNKEIDEVSVAGDEAYREAKDFMRMLMPSHAKNVQPYKEPQPIFVRHQVERQLSAMFSPTVTLDSGGYIVINQTEALVSIDVNSGKATREHSIEDTALKTNLEAAAEISRQLRLRDLAGLIVIDFIDMDERRNNRAVERKLKECLRTDRARIQVGRISHFGLLEMSRQRLRTGVLEGSTTACTICQGTGVVRSTESVALDVLRTLEDTLMSDGAANLTATTSVEAALYILNQKRANLRDIEARYGISIAVGAGEQLQGGTVVIERSRPAEADGEKSSVVQMESVYQPSEPAAADGDEEAGRKRPRRRRRRKRGRAERADAMAATDAPETVDAEDETVEEQTDGGVAAREGAEDGGEKKKSRRRGRRGGRRARSQARGDETEMPADGALPAETGADAHAEDGAERLAPADDWIEPAVDALAAGDAGEGNGQEPAATAEHERPAETAVQPIASTGPEADASAPSADEPAPATERNGLGSEPIEPSPRDGNGDGRDEASPASAAAAEESTPAPDELDGETEARPEDDVEAGKAKPKSTGLASFPRRGWWQRRAD